eukprot:7167851-Lingulodinium_polyedra.AAC.1
MARRAYGDIAADLATDGVDHTPTFLQPELRDSGPRRAGTRRRALGYAPQRAREPDARRHFEALLQECPQPPWSTD